MDLRPPHADPDPLERHYVARAVVLAMLVSGVASAVGLGDGFRQGLPGVALGSPFLLHVERALVVGAGVATVLIFAVRGWVGYFPSKISTAGAEYLRRPAVNAAFDGEIELHEQLERLKAIQASLARSTQRRLDAAERDVACVKSQRAISAYRDDML